MKLLATATAILAMASNAAAATKQQSMASWYGPGLYGNKLYCGGTLSPSSWGVANKTMHCGTRLRICFRRCVIATVIDRGPFVAGRDFDLTEPVKRAIEMNDIGLIRWNYA